MTYNFPLLELCGKAPLISLNTFLFRLKGVIVAHSSCVFTVSASRWKLLSSSTSTSDLTCFVDWIFFFPSPYTLRLLQWWEADSLKIVYCWVLSIWGSFHSWLTSGKLLGWGWNRIHEDIGLFQSSSCLLWWLQEHDVSLVLRWVCPIGHISCFYVPLKKVFCL